VWTAYEFVGTNKECSLWARVEVDGGALQRQHSHHRTCRESGSVEGWKDHWAPFVTLVSLGLRAGEYYGGEGDWCVVAARRARLAFA